MMSIEYIQELANDAATLARHQRLEPKVVADTPFLDEDLRSIPNLGDYVPEDWELIESHFVDSSGVGEEGEASLTFDQFKTKVRIAMTDQDAVFGWGLIQAGQFQVYIGQFKFRST